jgi:hypothetical protein
MSEETTDRWKKAMQRPSSNIEASDESLERFCQRLDATEIIIRSEFCK